MVNPKIENFNCTQMDNLVCWKYLNEDIKLRFDFKVYAEPLIHGDGVVVIENSKINAPDNAVLFDTRGVEKTRIKNPLRDAIAFSDLYYIGDELTLISMAQTQTSACVVDANGQLVRVYETR